MKDAKNPIDVFNAAAGNLTSGNPFWIGFGLSVLLYMGFSFLSFTDGLGGKGCGTSPRFNNLVSWYQGAGCFVNGFLKYLPRHEGTTAPSGPR